MRADLFYPPDLRYHPEDTWAREEFGGLVRVGITDYAQDQLGEIVFVELPEGGTHLTEGVSFGEIESAKTAAALHAPVSGVVVESNKQLEDRPELINGDPYGDGWIVLVEALQPSGDLLLGSDDYQRLLESRS